MNLLEALNDSQRAAVEYIEGPQLVIAGAGSGKTRVLTYKIAYLIQKGLPPWSILALTFTNKAAKEMKERIAALVGYEDARRLHMGTFHSIFSRILRVEAEKIGYNNAFTIYDESDSRSLIKAIVKELGLDDKVYKPSTVHARISMAKNKIIGADRYAADGDLLEQDKQSRMPMLHAIYQLYAQRCRNANAMDFDDLLMNTFLLFQTHEDVRQKYAQHFQYILVDEYQDTNAVQQSIVSQLTKEQQHICVVGDDAQSIYGFRGANIDNILQFQNIYPDTKLFKLEQNYRSTQHIVQAANSLIKHNRYQIPKDVFSQKAQGDKLTVKAAVSDREEAAIVCKHIKELKRQEHCTYNSFAILYRTNSQSRSFEEELLRQNIPYIIYGGLSFYQRKEIKDIIAYFRLVINPDDEEALRRIINYPTRGIGNTTLQKIIDAAHSHNTSLFQVIASPESHALKLNSGTRAKLDTFKELIESFIADTATVDAHTLGTRIMKESGITADIFSGTDVESLSRQENLEEFLSGLQAFVDTRREEDQANHVFLADYLQEVSLLSDVDSQADETEKVTLMTIHASKGLEFPTVFIVGLEENIFPSPMMCDSVRKLEEERRLLYVAITRAEQHCILTYANNRYRYGTMEFNPPSRFLREIDKELLVNEHGGDFNDFGMRRSSYSPAFGTGRSRMQNSRPVASQFMADPKPRITAAHRPEPLTNPLSPSFKKQIAEAGGNLQNIRKAIYKDTLPPTSTAGTLAEGCTIEHQRFGVGKVLKLEGIGENMRATVSFRNIGTKQLLLKFAKFTILSSSEENQ